MDEVVKPAYFNRVLLKWIKQAATEAPVSFISRPGGIENRELLPSEKAVLALRLIERAALVDIANKLNMKPAMVSNTLKKGSAVVHYHDRKQLRATGSRKFSSDLNSLGVVQEHILLLVETEELHQEQQNPHLQRIC